MNHRPWQPLFSALALPLLAASGLAQTTGVAHPDTPDDTVQTTGQPATTDHYVMPSHVNAPAPAPAQAYTATATYPVQNPGTAVSYPATAVSYPATAVSYPATAVSYPATGSAAQPIPAPGDQAPQSTEPSPALLTRQPGAGQPSSFAAYPPAETAAARHERLADGDYGIVTEVPAQPFELPAGTVLKTRLDTHIGTEETRVGTQFTAQLLAEAGHGGHVLLPAGSVIRGRVTTAHGGRRIAGSAALRLQPESITLPDGVVYRLDATLSDVEGADIVHVNSEGTVKPKTDVKATAAVLGGTAAVAAVTGAVIGGGVGALVGAGIGAGIGTVVWLRQDQQATLPVGTTLFFSLDQSLQLNPS